MPTNNTESRRRRVWARSIRQLAAEVGLATATLIDARERGCPVRKTSRGYHIPRVRAWLEERRRQTKPFEPLDRAKLQATVELLEARAERSKLELEEFRSQLVSRDVAREVMREHFAELRAALEAAAEEIAPAVAACEDSSEGEQLLRDAFRDAFGHVAGETDISVSRVRDES